MRAPRRPRAWGREGAAPLAAEPGEGRIEFDLTPS